jgi:predicted dithiol-disulfide oxidoreductase (DUF899 family)
VEAYATAPKLPLHNFVIPSPGTEALVGTHNYLDFVPKGRDEDHLADPMSWVRFKDRY